MHSISLVIHLIYSLQHLPLQNDVSRAPIGVVIAQLVAEATGAARERERENSLFKTTGA